MISSSALKRSVVVGLVAAVVASCKASDSSSLDFAHPLASAADLDFVPAFADEFDDTALDPQKFGAIEGDPVHKNTVNSVSKAQVGFTDGAILLNAAPTPADPVFPYATGYVDTQGLFAQTYGKIEFRARCKYAPGVWYAMWGRAWADLVPEIDIEFLAENITQVWFVNHWALPPLPADDRRGFTTVNGIDISTFHTYTIVWGPELLEWQIDGKAYRQVTGANVPHTPMFWILNAWVGGWGGDPSPATQFPASLEVDYLRVQRLATWQVDPAIRVAKPKPSYGARETIAIEIADFDDGATVEMREGDRTVATLAAPPFRFPVAALSHGDHVLTFHATDGSRAASVELAVTIN